MITEISSAMMEEQGGRDTRHTDVLWVFAALLTVGNR